MKLRSGGLKDLEQRVLDGDVRAMRALVRQASGPNVLNMGFQDVEIRVAPTGTGGDRLLFTGYSCVTESPYTMTDWLGDYTEIVRSGAFTKTLSESPDVVFCLNHDWGSAPMARTKAGTHRLSEDSTGLAVEADLDPTRADVHALRSCMDAGELDAMSFAFYAVRQLWSPDYEQRDLIELDINGGDSSVVTHPANPSTTGTTGLRAAAGMAMMRSRVPALISERARIERTGDGLTDVTAAALREVLSFLPDSDTETRSVLVADILGDNPPSEPEEVHTDSADLVVQRERLRLMAVATN
jgi:HK97 family phage prohead protease